MVLQDFYGVSEYVVGVSRISASVCIVMLVGTIRFDDGFLFKSSAKNSAYRLIRLFVSALVLPSDDLIVSGNP